jgi:predicted AAA+ superfamily ATPase
MPFRGNKPNLKGKLALYGLLFPRVGTIGFNAMMSLRHTMATTEKIIERTAYVEALARLAGDGKIKIVCGMRGVGKTEILKQLMKKLEADGKTCFYIDADSADFLDVDYTDGLMEKIRAKAGDGECTIFVDEITLIKGWTAALYNLTRDGKYDLYVTSSRDPSGDLKGSSIADKHEVFRIRPLSLKEFMELNEISDPGAAAEFYRIYGGMPCVRTSMGPATARRLLRSVYFDILYNGALEGSGADPVELRFFADYIMEHIGETLSKDEIKAFVEKRRMGTKKMAEDLENAYLVKAFIPGMLRGSGYRFFAADIGLRNSLVGVKRDWRAETENIVFDELVRRGEEPEYGRTNDKDSITSRGVDGTLRTYIVTDSPEEDQAKRITSPKTGAVVQIVPETEELRGVKLSKFMLGE